MYSVHYSYIIHTYVQTFHLFRLHVMWLVIVDGNIVIILSYFNGNIYAVCGMVFCKEDNDKLLKNKAFPSLTLQLIYDMLGIKNVQQLYDKMILVT